MEFYRTCRDATRYKAAVRKMVHLSVSYKILNLTFLYIPYITKWGQVRVFCVRYSTKWDQQTIKKMTYTGSDR